MGAVNPAGKEALLQVLAEYYKDASLLPTTPERGQLAPDRTCVSTKTKDARRVFEGGSDALRQWWRWSRATLPSYNK